MVLGGEVNDAAFASLACNIEQYPWPQVTASAALPRSSMSLT